VSSNLNLAVSFYKQAGINEAKIKKMRSIMYNYSAGKMFENLQPYLIFHCLTAFFPAVKTKKYLTMSPVGDLND